MQGRDRRLYLVGARSAGPHGRVKYRESLVDHVVIPSRAVLILEKDQLARGSRSRHATGMMQQHQSQQAPRLGLVWHRLHDHPRQTYGLVAQVVAKERA